MGIARQHLAKYKRELDDYLKIAYLFAKEYSYHNRIKSGRYNEIHKEIDYWVGKIQKFNYLIIHEKQYKAGKRKYNMIYRGG